MKKMLLPVLLAPLLALAAILLFACGHAKHSAAAPAPAADDDASPAAADDDDNDDMSVPPDQAFLPIPPEGTHWMMVFDDEFDGTELNTNIWTATGSMADPVPRRDGYWVKEAMYLDGLGHLVIETFEKDGKYYDGCIDTSNSFNHTYGYYEIRAKQHTQVGHWFAFWLIGGDTSSPTAAAGEEIDILEKPWVAGLLKDFTQSALHWDGSAGFTEQLVNDPQVMDGDYHTFGFWWGGTEYNFYVDGKVVWTTNQGGICQVPIPIVLSDEIGTNFFDNGNIVNAKLPDYTYVDYVRVFDLVDNLAPSTPD
jgi:hypothetical protein